MDDTIVVNCNQKCCVKNFENKRVRKLPEKLKDCQICFLSPFLFIFYVYIVAISKAATRIPQGIITYYVTDKITHTHLFSW